MVETVLELSGPSQYVCNYFIDNKIQRKTFSSLDPKHNEKMIGLESAIENGFLRISEDQFNKGKFYVHATQKLTKLYF